MSGTTEEGRSTAKEHLRSPAWLQREVLARPRPVLNHPCLPNETKEGYTYLGPYGIDGKMAERIATIDRAGRVVIPKDIRERMGLKEDDALLVAETDGDMLILRKLDLKEMAERLRGELKGVDVDKIAGKVERESNERARKEGPKALRR